MHRSKIRNRISKEEEEEDDEKSQSEANIPTKMNNSCGNDTNDTFNVLISFGLGWICIRRCIRSHRGKQQQNCHHHIQFGQINL